MSFTPVTHGPFLPALYIVGLDTLSFVRTLQSNVWPPPATALSVGMKGSFIKEKGRGRGEKAKVPVMSSFSSDWSIVWINELSTNSQKGAVKARAFFQLRPTFHGWSEGKRCSGPLGATPNLLYSGSEQDRPG